METSNRKQYKGLGENGDRIKYSMIKSMIKMGLNNNTPFITIGENGDITSINAIMEFNSINLIAMEKPFPALGGGGRQFLNIRGNLEDIVEIEDIGPFCSTGPNEWIECQRALCLPLVEFASHLTSQANKRDSNETLLNLKGRSDRPITQDRLSELRKAAATFDLTKMEQFVLAEKTDDKTLLKVLSIAKKGGNHYTIFVAQKALGTKKEDMELIEENTERLKLLIGNDDEIDSTYNGYSRVYKISKKQQ